MCKYDSRYRLYILTLVVLYTIRRVAWLPGYTPALALPRYIIPTFSRELSVSDRVETKEET